MVAHTPLLFILLEDKLCFNAIIAKTLCDIKFSILFFEGKDIWHMFLLLII
jgi:hypothetical protein